MPHLLVRQKFEDYGRWREAFDSLAEHRERAGLATVVVARNALEPDEAVVVFAVADVEQARRHAESPELQAAHRAGGVIAGSNRTTLLIDAD